jgi:hypothetical protein
MPLIIRRSGRCFAFRSGKSDGDVTCQVFVDLRYTLSTLHKYRIGT